MNSKGFSHRSIKTRMLLTRTRPTLKPEVPKQPSALPCGRMSVHCLYTEAHVEIFALKVHGRYDYEKGCTRFARSICAIFTSSVNIAGHLSAARAVKVRALRLAWGLGVKEFGIQHLA